jgi:hypothetical protein
MDQADPEEAHYLALGQRNAEAIELFERFCGNVRVEIMSGRGMLEAATGLPIAHRAFRCAYASGTVAYSMHLDDAAVEFYEQHCRGCACTDRKLGYFALAWAFMLPAGTR